MFEDQQKRSFDAGFLELVRYGIRDGSNVPPYLSFGRATDAAMPLIWAHSEYIKLYRTASDHQVLDLVEPAYDRYVIGKRKRKTMEIWKPNREVQTVPAGHSLANPSGFPISVALGERRLATLV